VVDVRADEDEVGDAEGLDRRVGRRRRSRERVRLLRGVDRVPVPVGRTALASTSTMTSSSIRTSRRAGNEHARLDRTLLSTRPMKL
jgi:hypothetical protein